MARDWVASALERGHADITADDVWEEIDRGDALLWMLGIVDQKVCGAVVTRIVCDRSGRKILEISAAGGELIPGWHHTESELVRYARAQGCSAMRLQGREGWTKAMRPLGWRRQWTMYEKSV